MAEAAAKLAQDEQAMLHYLGIGVRCGKVADMVQKQVGKGVWKEVFLALFEHELKGEQMLYQKSLEGQKE